MDKKLILIPLLILLFVSGWITFLWSDMVVLKNGSQISGEVIDQKDHYKVITNNGDKIINKKDVKAIYSTESDETIKKQDDVIKGIHLILDEIKELKENGFDKKIKAIDEMMELLQLLKDMYRDDKSANQQETVGVKPTKPVSPTPQSPITPTVPTFFGDPVTVKRVVCVIDRSSSMAEPYRHFQSGLDKIGRAKIELEQLIKSIPQDYSFNVIFFNTKAELWKDKLVLATDVNKKSALDFIKPLGSNGNTAIQVALNKALGCNPEIIYVVTDGLNTSGELDSSSNNKCPINWVYVGPPDKKATIERLQSIANATGGKFILPDETKKK